LKKFSPFIFLFIQSLSFWVFPGLIFSAETVRVTGVIDGDTIILSDGQRVRYLGIDAPEMGRDGRPADFLAKEACHFNRQLVLNKEVHIEYGPERRDRFDRLLAYVFLDNGLFVNGELIKRGLAYVLYHGPGMKHFDEFVQLQREAMKDSKGIWAKILIESDDPYRGQIHTQRFHRHDCSLGERITPKNLIIFHSKKEAYWRGYSPCRTCKP
jgi:micrococcal nuclease